MRACVRDVCCACDFGFVHACLRAQVTFCARVSDAHINSCLSNAHVLAQTTCTHARWLALTRITHARAHAHKLIHIS